MPEQRLWAPWRMAYVQAERDDEGCIFCLAARAGEREERLVSNFMAVTGGTRVLPQSLEDTYTTLRASLA